MRTRAKAAERSFLACECPGFSSDTTIFQAAVPLTLPAHRTVALVCRASAAGDKKAMFCYDTPARDMRFVLHELLDASTVFGALPGLAGWDEGTIHKTIEAAGRFARSARLPLNGPGDREGCRIETGGVKAPAGFAQAYRRFVEARWAALGGDARYGGVVTRAMAGKAPRRPSTARSLRSSTVATRAGPCSRARRAAPTSACCPMARRRRRTPTCPASFRASGPPPCV